MKRVVLGLCAALLTTLAAAQGAGASGFGGTGSHSAETSCNGCWHGQR